MVEGICKSFLQLFLVGMDGLTMNFAIQKLVPMEANQTLNEYNKVNATKVSILVQSGVCMVGFPGVYACGPPREYVRCLAAGFFAPLCSLPFADVLYTQ